MATSDSPKIMIRPEGTPNPASMRFVLDRPVLENGTADFTSASEAARSPLAQRLFALEGVSGVFLGPNFITVTAGSASWEALRGLVMAQISEHFTSGEPTLTETAEVAAEGESSPASETAQGVMRVIEEEIRPAVAMDGGDVQFGGYENGIVYLHLRGACSGCPSALFTLKMGIERRLKEEFPEIVAVEAV